MNEKIPTPRTDADTIRLQRKSALVLADCRKQQGDQTVYQEICQLVKTIQAISRENAVLKEQLKSSGDKLDKCVQADPRQLWNVALFEMTEQRDELRQQLLAHEQKQSELANHVLVSDEQHEVLLKAERECNGLRQQLTERDRVIAELKAKAQLVVDGFDKGIFIRETADDDKPDWAVKALPHLAALGGLANALSPLTSRVTDNPQEDKFYEKVERETGGTK